VASEKVADVENGETNGANGTEEAGTQEDCRSPFKFGCGMASGGLC